MILFFFLQPQNPELLWPGLSTMYLRRNNFRLTFYVLDQRNNDLFSFSHYNDVIMGVISNHQPHDCLLNRLFRRRSKKTPKLRLTGLCAGNSPGTGEFPAQMASNAENVSIWWRHHVSSLDMEMVQVVEILFRRIQGSVYPLNGTVPNFPSSHDGAFIWKRSFHIRAWQPIRRQSIAWTNAYAMSIGHLGKNFSKIRIKMQHFFIHENASENVVCEMAAIIASVSALFVFEDLSHRRFCAITSPVR